MDHFYGRKRQRRLNSLHLYSKDNKCVVNFVIRFENLENDLLQLKKHFNFYSTPNSKSFKIKSYTRSPFSIKRQNLFDKDTENLVAECCSDEISLFNYDFEGKNQLNGPFIKNF